MRLVKYFLLAIIGSILTPLAHEIATSQRGYGAIGGEFLIIPLILIAALAVEQVKEAIGEAKEVFKEEEVREWEEKGKASSTTRC